MTDDSLKASADAELRELAKSFREDSFRHGSVEERLDHVRTLGSQAAFPSINCLMPREVEDILRFGPDSRLELMRHIEDCPNCRAMMEIAREAPEQFPRFRSALEKVGHSLPTHSEVPLPADPGRRELSFFEPVAEFLGASLTALGTVGITAVLIGHAPGIHAAIGPRALNAAMWLLVSMLVLGAWIAFGEQLRARFRFLRLAGGALIAGILLGGIWTGDRLRQEKASAARDLEERTIQTALNAFASYRVSGQLQLQPVQFPNTRSELSASGKMVTLQSSVSPIKGDKLVAEVGPHGGYLEWREPDGKRREAARFLLATVNDIRPDSLTVTTTRGQVETFKTSTAGAGDQLQEGSSVAFAVTSSRTIEALLKVQPPHK